MIKNYRVQEKVGTKILFLALSIVALMIVFAVIFAKPASADGTVGIGKPPILSVSLLSMPQERGVRPGRRVILAYTADETWVVSTDVPGVNFVRLIFRDEYHRVTDSASAVIAGGRAVMYPIWQYVTDRGSLELVNSSTWEILWQGDFYWGRTVYFVHLFSFYNCPDPARVNKLVLVGGFVGDPQSEEVAWFYAAGKVRVTASFPLVQCLPARPYFSKKYNGACVKRGWIEKRRNSPPIYK